MRKRKAHRDDEFVPGVRGPPAFLRARTSGNLMRCIHERVVGVDVKSFVIPRIDLNEIKIYGNNGMCWETTEGPTNRTLHT